MYFILRGLILFLLLTPKSCYGFSIILVLIAFLIFQFISWDLFFFSSPVASLYSHLPCFKLFFTNACPASYATLWMVWSLLLVCQWRGKVPCTEIAVEFCDAQLGGQWENSWLEIAWDWVIEKKAREKRDVRNLNMWKEERCWEENVKVPF